MDSLKVKEEWKRAKAVLNTVDTLSLEDTIEELKKDNLYLQLQGKAKNRTLLKTNPRLYKSVYRWSEPLEDKMKESGRYASAYNFAHRLKFIVEHNANIENLRCKCGRRYSWTGFCRKCSPCSDLTSEERARRSEKASKTWRVRIGLEMKREGKSPRYDLEAIGVLDRFAQENNLNLRHAEHGGEVFVKELGYWLDGYDEEKNILVEIDEPYHFRKDLVLIDRDIKRHRAIQKLLHCKVYHIYFNKRTNRTVLYNSPTQPENWDVNKGIELTEVVGINGNRTKQYAKYSRK